jgi:hypothetical protein
MKDFGKPFQRENNFFGVWPGISSIFDEKKAKHIVIKIGS